MNKKIYITILAILGMIFILSGLVYYKNKSSVSQGQVKAAEDASSIIFFYGRECPHCKNVEEYIAENNLSDKISFSQREIYHDAANAKLAVEKAAECGVSQDKLGVPFLWSEGKCYFGEDQVENFLSSQVK